MAEFNYRAVSLRGAMEEGVVSAPDLASAREILKARGFTPIKIVEGRPAAKRRVKKLTIQEVVYFCRQFATILNAGISLVNGLNILRRQKLSRTLRSEVERLFAEVQTGRPLSEVMEEAEGRYPKLLVNMIATGEVSGSLDTVLSSMAAYYEREAHIRQKLQSLMIYPAILIFAAFGLIIFFVNFLLPELLKMLQESGVALPAVTRLVIFITNTLRNYFPYFVTVLVLVALLIKKLAKKPGVKLFIDRLLVRLPVIGNLLRAVIHARFCRTLGILLKSGVPLMQALESVERVIDHSVAAAGVRRAIEGLRRGEPVAANLATARFFDDLFIQFISLGEETGELENILNLMTGNYEQQSETAFARLTAVVEPAMTLVMGVIVGGIVLSVVLPMFSMLDSLKR